MGIFDFLKKEETKEVAFPLSLKTTTEGKIVPMKDIPDPVFAEGMVGPCIGVEPTNGKIVAPCDGSIMQLSDTLHAFGIQGPGNVLVMVHIGIDTVSIKGEGFTSSVKVGDKVKAGQTIVEVDFDKVKEAGHPTVVMTIITNPKDFSAIDFTSESSVSFGDELIKVSKD